MNYLTTAGRFLFAIPFAIFGINHFVMLDFYMGIMTSFIPFSAYAIILTGLLLIALSISIMARWYIKEAAYILAALLLTFIVVIHIPNLISGEKENTITIIALLKDVSLMGGSLMIAGVCGIKESVK